MSSSLLFLMKLIFLLTAVMSLAQPLHDSPPPFPSPHTQSCEEEVELLKTPLSVSDETIPSSNQPQPFSSSEIQHKPLIFGSSNTKPSESDFETPQPPPCDSDHTLLSNNQPQTQTSSTSNIQPKPLSFESSNTKPSESGFQTPQPPQIISQPHKPQNNFLPPKPRLLVDEQKPCGANAFFKEESCFCKEGYRGNPYIGCVDIDECLEIGCETPAKCTNLPGSYYCRCPYPYDGDGKLDGSGCIYGYQRMVHQLIQTIITSSVVCLFIRMFW